jgi:hypothetical protein
MILFMAAAAALLPWTGPHTEQYTGPGYFCGGGYAVQLGPGERALVLPQGSGAEVQGVRLVLSRGEVNVWTGVRAEPGRIVSRDGGSAVTEQDGGDGISYIVSNDTDFGLRLTSAAFRGFKQDKWFFSQANFSAGADDAVRCLAAVSY